MLWRPIWRPRRIAWCDDRESVILLCVERHCRVQNLFYFSGADEYLPKERRLVRAGGHRRWGKPQALLLKPSLQQP